MEDGKESLIAALERIAAGDATGMDDIYEQIGSKMLAVAFGVLRNRALAEEAVSESFERLARNADKFRRRDNPGGWILKLVRNVALNVLRREKKHRGSGDPEDLPFADDRTDPARTEDGMLLREALGRLREEERTVLIERYWYDSTVREIAKRHGLSKSAAGRLLQTAEQRLREEFGKDAGQTGSGRCCRSEKP